MTLYFTSTNASIVQLKLLWHRLQCQPQQIRNVSTKTWHNFKTTAPLVKKNISFTTLFNTLERNQAQTTFWYGTIMSQHMTHMNQKPKRTHISSSRAFANGKKESIWIKQTYHNEEISVRLCVNFGERQALLLPQCKKNIIVSHPITRRVPHW